MSTSISQMSGDCDRQASRIASAIKRYTERLAVISCSSLLFSTASANASGAKAGVPGVASQSIQMSELDALDSESIAQRIFPDQEPVAQGDAHVHGVAGAQLASVVKKAETMIGTRYLWGGNTPEEGLDCSGFVRYVYQKVTGMRLPRLSAQISQKGSAVAQPDLHPGDLVFFNTPRGEATHVGIYVGAQQFIHAPKTGAFIRVESMKSAYWTTRYYGARRFVA
jgi:cell wall-associated NlpC family hydrolase